MLPYEYENAGEYRAYLKGYVLPQFDGWRSGGALTGYEVAMNRYPVGPPWDSLAILEYRDLEPSDIVRRSLTACGSVAQ